MGFLPAPFWHLCTKMPPPLNQHWCLLTLLPVTHDCHGCETCHETLWLVIAILCNMSPGCRDMSQQLWFCDMSMPFFVTCLFVYAIYCDMLYCLCNFLWHVSFVEVCPDPFPANFTGSGPGRDRGFRDWDGIGICPRVPRRDPSRDPSRDPAGIGRV